MEIQQLRYFLAAARLQHITRAAEEAHVAQPALSRSIGRLEEELGVELFEKNGRRVALTHEGEILQKQAGEALRTLDNLPALLQESKKKREAVIGIRVAAASIWIAPAIIAYKKNRPEITIDFMRDGETSDVDFIVTANTDLKPEAEIGFCVEEQILLAVSQTKAEAFPEKLLVSSLRNEKFLSINRSKPFYEICRQYCAQAGFLPNIVFECDSPAVIFDLIAADLGIAFCPAFSWGSVPKGVTLLPFAEPCARKIELRPTKESLTAAQRDFYRYLTNYMRKTMPQPPTTAKAPAPTVLKDADR